MKKTILALLFLTACGKSGDSPAAIKGLFSSWTLNGCTNGGTLDLTQGNLTTTFASSYTYPAGEKCNCTSKYDGTNYTVTSCTYVASSGLGSDPGCVSKWVDHGTYSIGSDSILRQFTVVQPASQSVCLIYK